MRFKKVVKLLFPFRALLLIMLLTVEENFAQSTSPIEREKWDNNNTVQKPDEKYSNESAVILLDKRQIEYIDEKEELAVYKTLRRRVHIIDDRGIERFNKVYLPVSSTNEIVDISARTILPDGKVITVDINNVRDLKEEDQLYKIFAMEGLVKGCDVEFYYTYKTDGSYFGRETIQGGFPVKEAHVIVIAPERLVFETKGFNNVNEARDTLLNSKRFVTIVQKDIPGVEDEKYSNYKANLKRVEFKLSYNHSRKDKGRLFTWNELAKRAYENYNTISDKEIKKVNSLISEQGWEKLKGNEVAIVTNVEDYLKRNFSVSRNNGEASAQNLELVIKSKISNHRGINRLFGAIFKQLNVAFEFVLCGSRDEYIIDKHFENWNNCENELLYFPKLKKYIAPTLMEMRYPLIDPLWVDSYGIFCKGTTIGNFTTAIAEIKLIRGTDHNWSGSNIDAKLKLNASMDTLVVESSLSYTGYSSIYYRARLYFGNAEQEQLLIKELAKFGTRSERIISSKLMNKELGNLTDNKPLTLDLVVNASELVDKAGNKVLVKIGEIIGQQSEMYQEKPRQFNIDVAYPHILHRTIELIIPDGYKIKNVDDLSISSIYKENGEVTMGFESAYKLDGNVLKVKVTEQYCNISYPLSQYEDFKKVINAAADFNKVILVLEPK